MNFAIGFHTVKNDNVLKVYVVYNPIHDYCQQTWRHMEFLVVRIPLFWSKISMFEANDVKFALRQNNVITDA